MIRQSASLTTLVLFPFLCIGCESDSTGPRPTPADFSGMWGLQFEVVGKRTCDEDVGDTHGAVLRIAQRGEVATALLSRPVNLSIRGSRATGSATSEDRRIDLDLRIADGELVGTYTITSGAIPCTQVESLVGGRINDPPSPEFGGIWDLSVTVEQSECDPASVGETKNLCRRIRVDSNTVWMEDPEGVLLGVGDCTYALLERRHTNGNSVLISLSLEENSISGELQSYDVQDQCWIFSKISGTRSETPCE